MEAPDPIIAAQFRAEHGHRLICEVLYEIQEMMIDHGIEEEVVEELIDEAELYATKMEDGLRRK